MSLARKVLTFRAVLGCLASGLKGKIRQRFLCHRSPKAIFDKLRDKCCQVNHSVPAPLVGRPHAREARLGRG